MSILLPIPVRFILGKIMYLGGFYYIYMGMLAVFCTNSINIYAGVNGLEVGQSLIIGCAIMAHNIIVLVFPEYHKINKQLGNFPFGKH